MITEKFNENVDYDAMTELLKQSIYENPYLQKINPYDKQYLALLYANMPNKDKRINQLLVGAGSYGGKTLTGSMLACQYLLSTEDYTCLVTRRNYAELLDTNSIWDNLVDWCSDEDLPLDLRCNVKRSPSPVIESPVGNKVYFKAFDHEAKKQKFKSASYDRIVNDEASELPLEVLRFQYRSLRNNTNIPLSLIHLSNPSGTNPESNDYLAERFVDGSYPYIAMDWRDNPFIDKEAYNNTLSELDYVDQQFQKYGNWHYKPVQGDLISREEVLRQVTTINMDYAYSLISIDLAGKGKDKFAVCRYDYYQNGLTAIVDFAQTESANVEDLLLRFVEKHNPSLALPSTSLIVIEQEGGGSPVYAQRYFQELIPQIPVILKTPKGNKYQRARPLMNKLRNGNVKINQACQCLEDFIDEAVSLNPEGKGKSPNLVDSVTLAHNYLNENVLGKQSSIRIGGHI